MGLTVIVLFGLFGLLLFLNVPLVAAIGVPTFLMLFLGGFPLATMAQRVYMAVDSFSLLAIPLFMLAGKIMEVGGMSKRIIRLANCLVGWMVGGLAHVAVVSCAFFGALSGSSPATTAAMGSILIPEMKKKGFPVDFTAGLVAVSGCLGTIIPPSIPMVIYGITSGTSIGKLFIAGIVPGIMMSTFLMITVYFISKRKKFPKTGVFTFKELKDSFKDAIGALMVPIIILGGIYGGFFTPTEAGVIAVVYGFLISIFYYKEINLEDFPEIIGGAAANTVLVTIIVAVSGAFSWLLTVSGTSALIGKSISSYATTQITFLIIANILLLFVGCFIETVAGILIVTPVLFPIVQSLGIDPIHFGIIVTVNLSIGMATPPVGENQYIAAAIAKIPFEEEVKAALPFLAAAILSLIVITFIPQISLWLPTILKMK